VEQLIKKKASIFHSSVNC